MKGDFTRFTHDPRKHFNRVYKQQGRAELDADFNEHVDLATDLARNATVDVVGKAGVPKDGSFEVEVLSGNTDLLIRKGRLYLDGIQCALEEDVHYTSQPGDLPQPALSPVLNRKDLVYLHVMERHITWVEDEALLEPALQGADTCTRVQTVTQIRVQTGIAGASTCGAVPNWPPSPSGGRLTSDTKSVGAAPNPCVLPESGGFSGTENRLYRVEVHTGGSLANGTFKWSRDDGAVVVPVEFINETHRVKARTLGRDQVLGLKKGDWVELASDTTDLTPSSGTLAQIIDITSDLIVQLSKDISSHNGQTHPKLRRWDQGSDAVSMANGATLDLEDGITVKFSGANFQPGDAWMFTARIGSDVQKLTDAPPSAIVHHYAPLAIITWGADPNNPGAILPTVESCRPPFPPLTNITADDVKFNGSVCEFGPNVKTVQQAIDVLCLKDEDCCTLVVRPGPNWMDVFNQIPAQGAHLCFQPGVYETSKRLEITGKGTIVISGVRDAAKIVATDDECALSFVNCVSVTIRDLSAQGMVAQLGSKKGDGIFGVVSLNNVLSVVVENCRLQSAAGPHRTTSCLCIRSGVSAWVLHNHFLAGVQQVGVLFSNVPTVRAEGNLVSGDGKTISSVFGLLNDPQFLAAVRTRLITHLFVGSPAPDGLQFNVLATVGGQQVRFLGPATHVAQWTNLLQQNPLPGNPSKTNIEDHVLELANRILRVNPFPSFSGVRAAILSNITPSAQGITVGGTAGSNIAIVDNTVAGFVEGIHVGLSGGPGVFSAQRVQIQNNMLEVLLGLGSTRGRHGIFVGNANSVSVRENRLTLERPPGAQGIQIDGVRVFGRMGRSIMIRENHLTGFNTGIHFEHRGPLPPAPMWMINDNLAEGSSVVVNAPNPSSKTNNSA